MKLTTNRKLIMRLLDDQLPDCGNTPPYSASSLHWALHNNGFAEWYAEHDGLLPPIHKPPTIQQIHRTLKDLAKAGLITCEYRMDDHYHKGLPKKVAYWQLADKAERNKIVNACNSLHTKTNRAKFGINFFGATIDKGLPPEQVTALKAEIKALMQKTHPDKAAGYDEQFKQLQEALAWIKDGIPGRDDDSARHDKPSLTGKTTARI